MLMGQVPAMGQPLMFPGMVPMMGGVPLMTGIIPGAQPGMNPMYGGIYPQGVIPSPQSKPEVKKNDDDTD